MPKTKTLLFSDSLNFEKADAIRKYFKDKRKIYYSEIDLNSHLNNCSYIKLLVDLKDKKFYEKYKISRINVSYKKELNEGDKVDIYCSNLNPNYIEIKKGDEVCFTAEVTYISK